MNKEEIKQGLLFKHEEFIKLFSGMTEKDFMLAINDKWTAGQQLDHIIRSVKPLTQIFLFPSFLIRLVFGKANRPSKDYESLVKKYLSKIEQGGKASGRFVPQTIPFRQRENLTKELFKLINKLVVQVDGFSEEQLDELILPHPLLGKLTLREMLCFTIYHVEHHHKITLRNIEFASKISV